MTTTQNVYRRQLQIFSTLSVSCFESEGVHVIRSIQEQIIRGVICVGLALAATGSHQAVAEDRASGNYWLGICKQPQYDYVCAYYITGLVDGLMMGVTETSLVPRGSASKVYGYCPPHTTSVGDMKKVFLKYLEEHPKQRQYTGASLALEAWKREWPCPK